MTGRSPSLEVRRQLRREVNFGCPVPGCGKPFLTWHHFDPPYRDRPHQDPKGMIALCREHHDAAEGGAFTREQLRAMKANPISPQDIRARFAWLMDSAIVVLGSNFALNRFSFPAPIVSGDVAILLDRGPDGEALLSFCLFDEKGDSIRMIENELLLPDPEEVHDIELKVNQTSFQLWHEQKKIAIGFRFRRDVAETAVRRLLRSTHPPEALDEFFAIEHLKEKLAEITPLTLMEFVWQYENLSPALVLGYQRMSSAADSEGMISVLEFNRLECFDNRGRRLRVIDDMLEYGGLDARGTFFSLGN